MHHFAERLSVAPRNGRSRYEDGRDYLRFAFLTPEDADTFQARFGGRRLTMMNVSGRWRDDYLSVPIDTAAYFRKLTARSCQAVAVPYRHFVYSVQNDCRGNVRRYIDLNGGKAALGWLVKEDRSGSPSFMIHAVVAIREELLDITLTDEERAGCRFLLHEGTADANVRGAEEQYEWLHRRVGGSWYTPSKANSG